ncbi:hypothetical protein Plhal304r1_c039g0117161 [Plasmopara halstedii]
MSKNIQAHCFVFRLSKYEPTKDFWMNQILQKHHEKDRIVVVGRFTIHHI